MRATSMCSERRQRWRRYGGSLYLLVAWGFALVVMNGDGTARADGETPVSAGKRAIRPAYCGVHSLYRALHALGKDVEFARLVKPEYISSKQGSTVDDLQKAARDFGAVVEPMNRMTCAMLGHIKSPVILHVKPDLKSDEYTHWILFMGIKDGKPWIYDGELPGVAMGLDELAARWDGAGLLVSDSAINKAGIWTSAACSFLMYAGWAAFTVGLLYWLERRWRGVPKPSWRSVTGWCVAQAAGLVIVALGAGAVYRAISDHGFLSSPTAIAEIQDFHFGNFLPKVKTADVARLLETPGVAIVDARLPPDYKAGHLKGAISIPVGSSAEKCQEALADVPRDDRIVIYSHSSGCAYGEKVARVLLSLGYENISIFKGGWVEWEKSLPLAGSPDQLVKGKQ